MEVFLVYAETYDVWENTQVDYVLEVFASLSAAEHACEVQAELMCRDFSRCGYEASKAVDEYGNIVVRKHLRGELLEEVTFTVERRIVADL